ncbi:MAG: phosphoribosylanthranilate isomerase, partial [Acidimicrobiales bacterium]
MIVKVCGTTNEDDALLSVALGADMLGFIFAPSPRQIAPQVASDIAKRLPADEVVPVGVFRDELPQRVVDIALRSGMRAVQLHGDETPEQTRWIRARVPMVIKVFAAGDRRVARAREYGADVLMLDAPSPGSGRVFDWALAAEVPSGRR